MKRLLTIAIALIMAAGSLSAQQDNTPRAAGGDEPAEKPRLRQPGDKPAAEDTPRLEEKLDEPNLDNVTDPRMREHLKAEAFRRKRSHDVMRALEARRRSMNIRRMRDRDAIERPDKFGRPGLEVTRPDFGLPNLPKPAEADRTRLDPITRLEAPRPGFDRDSPVPSDVPRFELPDVGDLPEPQKPDTGSRGYDFTRLDQLEREYEENRITRDLGLRQRDPARLYRFSSPRFDAVDPTFGRQRSQGTHLDSPYTQESYGFGGALNNYGAYRPTFRETLSPRRSSDRSRITAPKIRRDPRSYRTPGGANPNYGLNPGSTRGRFDRYRR
jgi:hypothetical protein